MADPASTAQLSVALTSLTTQDGFNSVAANLLSALIQTALGVGVALLVGKWRPKSTVAQQSTQPNVLASTAAQQPAETKVSVFGYVFGFLLVMIITPFGLVWLHGESGLRNIAGQAIVGAAFIPTVAWLRNSKPATWLIPKRGFIDASLLSVCLASPASIFASTSIATVILTLKIDQWLYSIHL